MPKIAFIMQTFYGDQIGGAERQVQILAEALREQGWETWYICERTADKPASEDHQGMKVLALPLRKKRAAWRNYGKLKAAMRESQADIFYQRVRHPYTGLAALGARNLKKPFVWAAASLADVIRKKDLRHSSYSFMLLEALAHPLNRYLEDWGILHADQVILQTEEQRLLLEKNYQRTGAVLPNHLVLQRAWDTPKPNPPEVLWISNIKPFKRPELFLELARKCSDLSARFIMAGACPAGSLLQKLEKAQYEQGNFAYLGALKPDLAEKRISEAALLVNTSTFEGFPNALQQAWYYGIPTLTLGVDPDGVIDREKLGFCADTLENLEAVLRRLLQNSAQLQEIGQRARTFARSHYDLSNLLPGYVSLFQSLISS